MEKNSRPGVPTPTYIGIAVVGVLVLIATALLIFVLFYCFCRRRKYEYNTGNEFRYFGLSQYLMCNGSLMFCFRQGNSSKVEHLRCSLHC